MLFPTVDFALFFAAVFLVAWLLNPFPVRWKVFMLLASYFFYGWWDARFVVLLAASTVINQALAVILFRTRSTARRRAVVVAALAANLAVLGWFKYYGFLATSMADALRPLGVVDPLPLLQVVLPVGISFFTFMAISYVVDIYRGEIEPAGFLDFAVYLAFFPHLVAGPIVRASELVPQLTARRDPRRVDASRALWLIFAGLFKKVVIASYLSTTLVDRVFATPGQYSSLEVLVGIYGYAVQIYADFSGYTDIAIGCALLLGFRFPENFDAPYTATSLRDFWRRWHITLSRWLRDYVYIPLGGSRRSPRATYRNLLVTMLLGGLWHGASWTFVVWGGLHGGGLAWEHRREERWAARGLPPPGGTGTSRTLRRLATFHLVCLGWVFFRAETFGAAFDVLRRLVVGGGGIDALTPAILLAIVVPIAAQYVPGDVPRRAQVLFSRLAPVAQGGVLAAALLVISALGPQGVAPFIYYQF